MNATAAWRLKGSESLQHCAACEPKEACGGETTRNKIFKPQSETEMDRGLSG